LPAAVESIGAFCSSSSLFYDCWDNATRGTTCPAEMFAGSALDEMRRPDNCTGSAPVGPLRSVRQCHYKPVAFERCFFVPQTNCSDSPQFPLLRAAAHLGRRIKH
jgi:hypothetical protein